MPVEEVVGLATDKSAKLEKLRQRIERRLSEESLP